MEQGANTEKEGNGPFLKGKRVREGDAVIMYAGHSNISSVKAAKDEKLGHRHGTYFMNDVIDLQFGSYVRPRNPHATKKKRTNRRKEQETIQIGGSSAILPVTPELWADSGNRRTQITFALHNNMVVSHLHLKPGSVVVESGTGSGVLSMFLARAVAPTGRVHTFEFNRARFEAAVEDFERVGVAPYISVAHRDAYNDGFGDDLVDKADAVFLDLPNPWKAIPHAVKVLKPFGRICTFSPCIEQVQRSVALMSRLGFSHIETMEVLLQEQRIWQTKSFEPPCFARSDSAAQFRSKEPTVSSPLLEEKIEREIEETKARGSPLVQISANKTPLFIPSCSFPQQEKFEQKAERVATCFDRIPGHTGYLTFAYAPLEKE